MIASTVRFSAAIARQPLKAAAASSSSVAGIKTSASAQAITTSSPLMVNEDGRLCSRNRRQHIWDPTAPAAKPAEPKWTSTAARNRDARTLAGF